MNIVTRGELSWVEFSLFKNKIKAAVTSRLGGVSQGPYQSLNMSFLVGDEDTAVIENRKRVADALGISEKKLVNPKQVHGTQIAVVDESMIGRGAETKETVIPDTDGLVTSCVGVPLMLLFADCSPLLFYDPVQQVVGLAHGGWRGTVGKIGPAMIDLMQKTYGSHPADILVGIGPTIGKDSFEVGDEVVAQFAPLFSVDELSSVVHKKHKRYYIDLPLANKKLLEQVGVLASHIEDCRIDTMQSNLFYSYRRGKGKTGRHAAIISL